ncbi:MAG TPA: hypothetical protein VK001_12810 [Geminicoccaceae bacterium]|nr:hypothetical protein [Geminicoccaceae bacterium]
MPQQGWTIPHIPDERGDQRPSAQPSWRTAPPPDTPPITDRFDDAYGRLLEALRQGQTGNELLQNLLGGFRGSIKDLKSFMETPAFRAALAYSTKALPEYQKLVNLEDPTKQILNVGLGQISSAGARAVSQQLGALQQMGMGRNAGLVGAAQLGGRLETAARAAQFTAGVNQQAYQNESQRLQTLIGLEQAMQQIALGFSPQPRQKNDGPGTGDWLKLGLEAAGTLALLL